MKKYYYLYKVTNTINGKIYIGVHQTHDLEDGYIGSGYALKRAKRKYGIENFTKEILQQFNDEEDMFGGEATLVDREFVLRKDTYNMTEGGIGPGIIAAIRGGKTCGNKSYELGFGWFSEEAKEKNRKYLISEENLNRLLENSKKVAESEEIQAKIKATMKKNKHSQGNKNSQYGTIWITNDKENKKIDKNEMIPGGWRKGRIIKNKTNGRMME